MAVSWGLPLLELILSFRFLWLYWSGEGRGDILTEYSNMLKYGTKGKPKVLGVPILKHIRVSLVCFCK